MEWFDLLAKGAAILGALTFVYFVGKYGLMPVVRKLGSTGSILKNDFLALEARVRTIEAHPALAVPPLAVVVPKPLAAGVVSGVTGATGP